MSCMHPLENRIHKLLRDRKLIEPGSVIITAVSGGPDSIALLHLLSASSSPLSFSQVAVYVDHGLRPDEVDAEKKLVLETARKLKLRCEFIAVDVRRESKTKKLSLEHAARELRYKVLFEARRSYCAKMVAVGHTADDQAEEILMRMLRGSSRKALSGMRILSGNILRPLLEISKKELISYLEDRAIPYCLDSSNIQPIYLRNRIRNDLLPLLEMEYDPGIRKALLKTAANLGEDEDLLDKLVAESWGKVITIIGDSEGYRLDRERFRQLHPALQRRVIERLLWTIGSSARYAHIIAVRDAAAGVRSGVELHLSEGLRAVVTRDHVVFCYPVGKGSWRGSTLRNSLQTEEE